LENGSGTGHGENVFFSRTALRVIRRARDALNFGNDCEKDYLKRCAKRCDSGRSAATFLWDDGSIPLTTRFAGRRT
jgi:hypothetical protein